MVLINENDDENNENVQLLDVYNLLENEDNNKGKRITEIFIVFYI